MRRIFASLVLALLGVAAVGTDTPRIQVVPHAVAPRVDITIDGKPFTSYIFERSQKKPSLYPLRTAKGTIVTRGYPLDPHPGERAIIRITSASGSTTATSTASTSGTTPTPFPPRAPSAWARSCTSA